MKKELIMVFIFMVCISPVFGVNIHGSIYDLSLDKVNDVIVIVNSSPMQRFVSQEGTYSFNLNYGIYEISVETFISGLKYVATENIEVLEDGDYVIDLFLYPDLDEENNLYDNMNLDIQNPDLGDNGNIASVLILIFGIFIFLSWMFIHINKKDQEEKESDKKKLEEIPADETFDDDLQEIISLLRKNRNRMTQKDIRKEIGLSEAKISLMIAELENSGILKKIKKGRGNIIVLR